MICKCNPGCLFRITFCKYQDRLLAPENRFTKTAAVLFQLPRRTQSMLGIFLTTKATQECLVLYRQTRSTYAHIWSACVASLTCSAALHPSKLFCDLGNVLGSLWDNNKIFVQAQFQVLHIEYSPSFLKEGFVVAFM